MARYRARPSNFSYINPCVKHTLFFFNLLFWVAGGLIIGIGVWSYQLEYGDRAKPQFQSAVDILLNISVVLMITGSFIFIISFSGCLGALRENLCLLKFYSIVLLLLFLGELVLASLGFIFPDKFSELAKEGLSTDPIIKYRDDNNLQNFIDILQQEFQCCGISDKGYLDWNKNIYFACNASDDARPAESCGVPFSCCRNVKNLDSGLDNFACGHGVQDKPYSQVVQHIFTTGCIQAIEEYARRNLHVVAGIMMGVAFVQLFAMYLSRTLIGQIQAQLARWH